MKFLLTSFSVVGLVLTVVSPTPAEDVKVGDLCMCASKRVAVQQGEDILGWITKGTRIEVQRVNAKGDWVRAKVVTEIPNSEGKKELRTIEGWIDLSELAICPKCSSSKQSNSPKGYAELATILADPTAGNVKDLYKKRSEMEVAASLRETINKAEAVEEMSDGALKKLAQQTKEELKAIFAATRKLDKNPFVRELLSTNEGPSRFQIGGTATISATNPSLQPTIMYEKVFDNAKANREVAELRLELAETTAQMQALRIMLRNRGAETSGPTVKRGQTVVVNFIESIVGEPDQAEFTNNSGTTLTNCTLFVEVEAGDAKAFNLHYLPKWSEGDTITALYPMGVKLGNKWFANQTVNGVERVTVSLYCDQLTQTGIVYKYRGAERDLDYMRHFDQLRLIVGSREGGFEGQYWIDVRHSWGGISNGKLDISVLRDGEWQKGATVTFEKWEYNERQSILFVKQTGKLNSKPTEAKLDLELSRNGYTYKQTYKWKAD